jgi:hypothetical protein
LVAAGALVVAAAVLALIAAVAGERGRQGITGDAVCAGSDPWARLRAPYAAWPFSAVEAREEPTDVPRRYLHLLTRRLLMNGRWGNGTGYFVASGDAPAYARRYVREFRAGTLAHHAVVRPITLRGHAAFTVQWPGDREPTAIGGMLRCGGLVLVADDTRQARAMWTQMAAPPG